MRNATQAELIELSENFGELVDHRSCVVYGQIIECTSYDDVHTVEVFDAPDVCNSTDAPQSYAGLRVVSAELSYCEAEANARWLQLIGERAAQFCRAEKSGNFGLLTVARI